MLPAILRCVPDSEVRGSCPLERRAGYDCAMLGGDTGEWRVKVGPLFALPVVVVMAVGGCSAVSNGKDHAAHSRRERATVIAVGSQAAYAVGSNGGLYAWGSQSGGAIGDGDSNGSVVSPSEVKGIHGAVSVAAGAFSAVVLTSVGSVYWWGNAGSSVSAGGGVGAGSGSGRVPEAVLGSAGGTGPGTGAENSRGGGPSVRATGSAAGAGICRTPGSTTPKRVKGLPSAVAVGAGSYSGYAVTDDGHVYAWAMGCGPWPSRPLRLKGLSGVVTVVAHGDTAYFLTKRGAVWAVGSNASGALGNGSSLSYSSTPVEVAGLHDITDIAAGSHFGMALDSQGVAWVWGDTGMNLSKTADPTHTSTRGAPAAVPGITNTKAIAAGAADGYLLRWDGTIWAWGRDVHGELGGGQTTPATLPGGAPLHYSNSFVPVGVPPAESGVAAIVAGYQAAFTIGTNGTVWSWGGNGQGQLGETAATTAACGCVDLASEVTGLSGKVSSP